MAAIPTMNGLEPSAMADEINTPEPAAATHIEHDVDIESPIAVEPDPKDIEIDMLKEEAASYKDRLLRTAAEMENLRKRAEREKAEATLYAATNFARDLLSVADNLQRALNAMSEEAKDAADEATKNLLAGVELTEKELLNIFQRYGIRRVNTVGHKFDPNLHQALFEMPTSEHPPGTVVQEMQSGFAIGDRCLRPAMVGVAKAVE
jgi:molecular chaperone GrpE